MALSYRVPALALYVLFVLAACMYPSKATFFPPPCPSPPPPLQNSTMTFYLQVIFANDTNNAVANVIPVAGIQGKAFGRNQFGTLYVAGVNITATPSPNSTIIGQTEGTLPLPQVHGFVFQLAITYKFTSGNFSGSTLETLGIFNMSQQVSNLSIIGGTNALTDATGYVTYEIIASQPPSFVLGVNANFKIAA